MNEHVKDSLRKMYIEYGDAVFCDKQKLLAYINDLLTEYPKEKKRISLAISEGIVAKMIHNKNNDADSELNIYASLLSDTYDISNDMSTDIISAIHFAIYGKTKYNHIQEKIDDIPVLAQPKENPKTQAKKAEVNTVKATIELKNKAPVRQKSCQEIVRELSGTYKMRTFDDDELKKHQHKKARQGKTASQRPIMPEKKIRFT